VGHSTRVGAARDPAELDIDSAAITQAGGWKSTRMPLQYAEKIKTTRGSELTSRMMSVCCPTSFNTASVRTRSAWLALISSPLAVDAPD
jgi:hypothetical protein